MQSSISYDYDTLSTAIHTLRTDGLISVFHEPQLDPYGLYNYYLITMDGKKAYEEKFYLNKITVRTWNFWVTIISTLISIAALIVAIIALKYDK